MTKWTAIVVLAVIAALVCLVAWLRYEFSPTLAAVALLALFGVVVFAAGALLSLASQRATLSAIVEFQAADDRGEVARARMLTEVVRGQNKLALQDSRHRPRPQDNDDMWRDVTPLLAAPQTWTPAQLPAQTGGDVVYYDGN